MFAVFHLEFANIKYQQAHQCDICLFLQDFTESECWNVDYLFAIQTIIVKLNSILLFIFQFLEMSWLKNCKLQYC